MIIKQTVCQKCKNEDHDKQIYYYTNGLIICYRCQALGRKTEEEKMEIPIGDTLKKVYSLQTEKGRGNVKLEEYLSKRGFNVEKVIDKVEYGVGENVKECICFPLWPSGLSCRKLDTKKFWIYNKENKGSVYCPTPEKETENLFLVEGPHDALRLYEYGYDAIALLGVNLTNIAKSLIIKKDPKNIYIWLDEDEAGIKNSKKIEERLNYWLGFNIRVITYKEPADCLTKEELELAIREIM